MVELLVVMAIIAILAAFAVPSMAGIARGANLSNGGEAVAGALSNARQLATSRNRAVEVRLVAMAAPENLSPGEEIRAIQIVEFAEDGAPAPGRLRTFPRGVIASQLPAMTSLASPAIRKDGDIDLPGAKKSAYKFFPFRFQPDGSLDLKQRLPSPSGGKYFLTLHEETQPPSGNSPPANFITIQLEPATGSYSVYRP